MEVAGAGTVKGLKGVNLEKHQLDLVENPN